MDFRDRTPTQSSNPYTDAASSLFNEVGSQPPPREPKRGVSDAACLTIVLLLSGGLMFLACAGIGVYVSWNRNVSRSVIAPRTTEDLTAEAAAAFGEFDATVELDEDTRQERRAINHLLRRIERAARDDDDAAFHELVDHVRFMKRVDATGGLVDWTAVEQYRLRLQLLDEVGVHSHWQRLLLANVVQMPGEPRSRVLYTFGWDADEDQVEVRWHVALVGEEWKIYDWERLDLGLTKSAEWGLYAEYSDDPRLDSFFDATEKMVRSDALLRQDDEDAAASTLRQVDPSRVLPELADYTWVLLGYRWRYLGDAEEALRCFDRVARPDAIPGSHMGRMLCYQEMGEFEMAVEAGNRYEALLGPSPDMLATKADLLAELGRDEEAAADLMKFLRIDPKDETTVGRLAQLLPATRKSDVEPFLNRLEDPIAVAARLASSARYGGDDTFAYLVSYVRERSPGSPAAAMLLGLAAETDGDWEEAAELYRLAFTSETNDEVQVDYIESFVIAMAECGRLLQGYEAVPQQGAAFEMLTYAYDEGDLELGDDEYRALVARHFELHPSDTTAAYHAAELAIEDKDYEAAEKIIRQALKEATNDDEYLPLSLQDQLARVMFSTNRTLQAYREIDVPNTMFDTLARLALEEERLDELEELLTAHAADHEDDPVLHYYEGRKAAREERWDEADRHFRRGLEQSEGRVGWRFEQALRQAAAESGRWHAYYEREDDRADAFRQLAGELRRRSDWETLDKLIEHHQQNSPDDPWLAVHRGALLWERAEYAESIEHFATAAASDSVESWERRRARDKQLRALLRLDRIDEARRLAGRIRDERGDPLALALVAAIAGRDSEALPLLVEAAESRTPLGVYRHPDGRRFLDDTYRELHELSPVPLYYNLGSTAAVLMLPDDVLLAPEAVRRAAKEVLGIDVEPQRLTTTNAVCYAFPYEGHQVWVAVGETPYRGVEWERELDDAELLAVMKLCSSWLAVGNARWIHEQSANTSNALLRFANQLAGDRATVLYRDGRLSALDDQTRRLLASDQPLAEVRELGVQVPLVQGARDVVRAREFRRALTNAARTFNVDEEPSLRVRVGIDLGAVVEPLWVRVNSSRREYDAIEVHGSLEDTSALIPELKAGLPVEVNEWEIEAFQVGEHEVRELSGR